MKKIFDDDYHRKCRENSKKCYCPKKKRIYHIMKKHKFDKSILDNKSVDEQIIFLEKKLFEQKFNLKL
jgi:hypothetical protein